MSNTAIIKIHGLSCLTKVGVHAYERKIQTKVVVDLSYTVNLDTQQKDELDSTVNYSGIANEITIWLLRQEYHLIETLLVQLSNFLKNELCIKIVSLSITKVKAINNQSDVSISLN